MAEAIGRTGSWLVWLGGCLCALLFGCQPRREGRCAAAPKYGPEPASSVGGARRAPTELEESADWKTVAETWAYVVPLARSGRSTVAQRQRAWQLMTTAEQAVGRLREARLLTNPESEVLNGDLNTIRDDLTRRPVTDPKTLPPAGGTCYMYVYVPPAKSSAERLTAWAGLVEQNLIAGRLHPAVAAKVLAVIEVELAILSERTELKALEKHDGAEARRKVEAVRERVRPLLDAQRKAVAADDGALSAEAQERARRLLAMFTRPEEAGAELPAGEQARLDRLVAELGAEDFGRREAGSEQLLAAGRSALPTLARAAKSADAEVAGRARQIIPKLEAAVLKDAAGELHALGFNAVLAWRAESDLLGKKWSDCERAKAEAAKAGDAQALKKASAAQEAYNQTGSKLWNLAEAAGISRW
jgi:hypothetical protein